MNAPAPSLGNGGGHHETRIAERFCTGEPVSSRNKARHLRSGVTGGESCRNFFISVCA